MKKIFLIALILSFALIAPAFVLADQSTDALIAELKQRIAELTAQLEILQKIQTDGQTWCHTFNTNLKIGDAGSEVDALQVALQKEGFDISDTENTPSTVPGIRTGVFGESTASAVTGFQEKYRAEILTPLGLKYGTGYVGKATRAKLNQLYGCDTGNIRNGSLYIKPANISLRVGETVQIQAMHQPPMPPCPEGFACIQVMPAPQLVQATWTSSNTGVATVGYKQIPCSNNSPPTNASCFDFKNPIVAGISAGTAKLTASYRTDVGASGVLLSATASISVSSGTLTIQVLSPNGGEIWQKGSSQEIRWTSNNLPDTQNTIIADLRDLAGNRVSGDWVTYTTDTTKLGGVIKLTVSSVSDGQYKIRLCASSIASIEFGTPEFCDSSDAPFSIAAAETITRTVGDRESSFLIQKINPDSVEGLWYQAYPVYNGQGSPRTLRIGDDIGYACEGVSEKLTSIDFSGQKVTFTKVVGDPPFGGCPICLAGNTLIDTPSGQVRVQDMKVGMSVWTLDRTGNRVLGVVAKTSKVPVPPTHKMVHLILDDGRELFASPGHPTVDGSTVGNLAIGNQYDGALVASTERVPYGNNATYDVLPSGETGFYWANGILLGSTLSR